MLLSCDNKLSFRSFNDFKFNVLFLLLLSCVIISNNLCYSQVFDDKTFLSFSSPCHFMFFLIIVLQICISIFYFPCICVLISYFAWWQVQKKERKRKKEKKKYINSEEFLRIPQHPTHRSLHLFLIIRHSRQNMKNENKLLLPFSINSRSFAPAFHASLHLFLYIFQFPYLTEMDTAFLFHIKHPLNKL